MTANGAWRLGISTGACIDQPIHQFLQPIAAAGVSAVEIATPPRHFDPLNHDQIAALERGLQARALAAVSIHAPFGGLLDLADPNPHHRVAAIGAVLTAAGAIKRLGGRLVVVHGTDLERSRHDAASRLADCARSLATIADSLRQDGLTMALESPLPHLIGGRPDEFRWLLDRLDESVTVCLDTGHTALGGFWRQFMTVAGPRLSHVHAHDNHGHWDDHLPPGEGRIDWADVAASLRDAGFTGWVILELKCPTGDLGSFFTAAIANARRVGL